MRELVIIAHNVRSALNIGSLLRTADGMGVSQVLLTGYTPYPHHDTDIRLPHIARKVDKQIKKAALGAEATTNWSHHDDIVPVIEALRQEEFTIAALEQSADSIALPTFKPPNKLAIIVGREVEGIEPEVLRLVNITLEIPMLGRKESFNVVQAAAMALYHCRYLPV